MTALVVQQEGIQRIGGFTVVIHQPQAVVLPAIVAFRFPVEDAQSLAVGDGGHLLEHIGDGVVAVFRIIPRHTDFDDHRPC